MPIPELREFTDEIKNMFDVTVTFDHDITFTTVASRNLSDVGKDIMAEIHWRMANFFLIFGFLDIIGGILCVMVIIKWELKKIYEHVFVASRAF